jgi:hypothetical protein
MFGSGFTLGFTLSDVTAQVTGFLSNPVIIGLIAVSLALITIPQIISVVHRIQYGGWAQYVEDLRGGDNDREHDDYVFTDEDMHNMEGY